MDDQKRQAIPVNVVEVNGILKVYTRQTKAYVGILIQSALVILLRNSQIVTEASLILPALRVTRIKSPKKAHQTKTGSPIPEPEIRITVYGTLGNAERIGKALSDADLYLQHPSPTDCSLQLRYHNPQFLIRPGHEMPTLEDLSIRASTSHDPQEHQLDEVAQARVLRIFDDAHGDVLSGEPAVEPSPRLRTALKECVPRTERNLALHWHLIWVCRHQRFALSFMSAKESRTSVMSSSRSLWRAVTDFEGKPT